MAGPDFGISCVTFNLAGTHIEAAVVHGIRETGTTVQIDREGARKTRREIVALIEGGVRYATILRPTGFWKIEARVVIIQVNGEKFLTTKPDGTPKDNLDKLPQCA
jgi:hypothetical protein